MFTCKIRIAALVLAVGMHGAAMAAPKYTITDLGVLAGGGSDVRDYGVNNLGQVVGVDDGRTVIWKSRSMTALPLGSFQGYYGDQWSINDSGVVVGVIADSTASEMVDEFSEFEGWKMVNGAWKPVPWTQIEILKMDFGAPFGRRFAYGMFLEEMRPMPGLVPGIQEAGFYVGGFNWFVDGIVFPLMPVLLKLRMRKLVERLLLWGLMLFLQASLRHPARKLEADGEKDGQQAHSELLLTHPDGYVFTAVPAVACLLQILDGSAHKPGVHMQALVVNPVRFLEDMKRMGIEAKEMGW